jgi:hypothetical protein
MRSTCRLCRSSAGFLLAGCIGTTSRSGLAGGSCTACHQAHRSQLAKDTLRVRFCAADRTTRCTRRRRPVGRDRRLARGSAIPNPTADHSQPLAQPPYAKPTTTSPRVNTVNARDEASLESRKALSPATTVNHATNPVRSPASPPALKPQISTGTRLSDSSSAELSSDLIRRVPRIPRCDSRVLLTGAGGGDDREREAQPGGPNCPHPLSVLPTNGVDRAPEL